MSLAFSGLIPAVHYLSTYGSFKAFNFGAFGWLIACAILYVVGAVLYATRIPERLFPGKFDIWVIFVKRLIQKYFKIEFF